MIHGHVGVALHLADDFNAIANPGNRAQTL